MAKDIRREDRPGLYCVELRTTNWSALVEWYREVLGLRVLVRVIDDGYALLEAGENRLALIARAESGPPSPRISLAFEVTDVRQVTARLRTAGARVTYPARDPEGLREASCTDPDGNRIRVFSWPGEH
jgi:hydroxymethylpyrimidine/phosphomethylpyrimidine kinase